MTRSPEQERPVPADLERMAEEQAALRRVATLVARGATEQELAAAVARELGHLFSSQAASVLRWDGDTIRVIGDWRADRGAMKAVGPGLRVRRRHDHRARRRVGRAGAHRLGRPTCETEFGKQRWAELGYEASIGAPIFVEGNVWGIVTASRTQPGDTFPPGAEQQLADFAALVAQSIVNAEARRETAALVAEQSALRRIATLVAGGKPQAEVVDEVTSDVGKLFGATSVMLVRWEGIQDEVVVVGSWTARDAPPIEPGTRASPRPRERDDPRARDGVREPLGRSAGAGRRLLDDRRAGDRQRGADRRSVGVASRRGRFSRRRGDQAAELRRPRGAVDRERARAGGAPSVARAPRSHGRRDARAARAEPPRRSAATARVGVGRAAARGGEAAVGAGRRAHADRRRLGGADARARGVARPRPRAASRGADEARARAGARGAREPRAAAGRCRTRSSAGYRRRSRRPCTTSSPSR